MQNFKNISSRAFEHSADRAALTALRRIKGFDLVLKKLMALIGEKRLRLVFLSSSVRINSSQRPDLYAKFKAVAEQFDLDQVPELYLTYDSSMNVAAIGVDRPFVIVYSGLVERLNEKELQFVFAHEIGHILCGHSLYRTLLMVLLKVTDRFLGIPRLLVLPILLGLLEWQRKSELTADRAGLLSVNDLQVAQSVIMKMCGAGDIKQYNLAEFEKQADEYDSAGDILDSMYKTLNLVFKTHPVPVHRLREIRKYAESPEMQTVISGGYLTRDDQDLAALKEDLAAMKTDYTESAEKFKKVVGAQISDLLEEVEARGSKVADALFGPRKN